MSINNKRQSINPSTIQHSINHRPVWVRRWEFEIEIESENALPAYQIQS